MVGGMTSPGTPQRRTNLQTTAADAAKQAREQAEAYGSIFAPTLIDVDGEDPISIPPHPDFGMLDDQNMEDYEDLQFERESYDRAEDIFIPEQRLRDPKTGLESGVVLPAQTRKGDLLVPFRKTTIDPETNEPVTALVRPPHSVKVVQAAVGEKEYQRLVNAGKQASDVWRIWAVQAEEVAIRRRWDAKSSGSPVDVAPVS